METLDAVFGDVVLGVAVVGEFTRLARCGDWPFTGTGMAGTGWTGDATATGAPPAVETVSLNPVESKRTIRTLKDIILRNKPKW